MKSILNIEGVKKLTSKAMKNVNGNGPDLCYSYWTFYRGDVWCCGNQCQGSLRD